MSVFHIARPARITGLLFAVGMLASSSCARSQAASSAASPQVVPHYDVISIKPNRSGSGSMHIDSYETTFQAQNVSLKMLLASAYGVRESLIVGVPAWAQSARWDINAKVVDPDPRWKDRKLTREESTAEFRREVQSILTERFHLKAHQETATGAIFDLVLAKGGSKLKPAAPASDNDGGMHTHNQVLTARDVEVRSLAQFLSSQTERNVVDKTGLTGQFDAVLRWSKDDPPVSGVDNGLADRPPTLLTAIEEQWGLKLVADKGPVTSLVVDSVDEPAAD